MGTRHHALKIRQRQERDDYPEDLSLRVHRVLSWLDRAEQKFDPDSRFIFLWIAFNAAYASEIDDRQGLSDQATFNAFLDKPHTLDKSQHLKAGLGSLFRCYLWDEKGIIGYAISLIFALVAIKRAWRHTLLQRLKCS
ncbi:hypothetical protein [Alcanivorax sp.]|uniref:hypothetical protein n=1 Tax=Alcanivorax sp. TaxID=1872427 RepID=UPI0032D90FD4